MSASSTVVERFAAQAAATPHSPALEAGGETLTYAELDARAARLARRLRRLGVGPGVVVGLLADRTPEMVVGILAAWKAGGAFLPLDPAYPAARLAFLLEDSGAAVLGVGPGLEGFLPPAEAPVVPLAEAPPPDPTDRSDLSGFPSAADLAYLIYTSGTTGRPKAVEVEHGQLAATMGAVQAAFGFGPGDRMPAIASFAFDIFLFELLGMLLAGGTCALQPLRPALDLGRLVDELGTATRFHAVPALMRQVLELARRRGGASPALRTLFTGGDAVPADLLAELRQAFPHAGVQVLYGPTEATIVCTAWPVPAEGPVRSLLGAPFEGTEVGVRDEAGAPVPDGEAGEIWIGGAGVARGYRGRPELTAERFVEAEGRRWFKSGDLGRVLPDGALEFLGRGDRQVKVRGFRVEPGEVEAALASHPAVREAVVLALPDPEGGARLVAYVTGAAGEGPRPAELRSFLAERLPGYMVPSGFVPLPALPLTENGKVDRQALALVEPHPEVGEGVVAPRTPLEEALAGIWAGVLGLPSVGVEDGFLDLGGHSLLATRIASRVREAFGVDLPPGALFTSPTVAALARAVEEAGAGTASISATAPPLPRIAATAQTARPARLPLSNAQRRLWLLERLHPGLYAYNVVYAVRLRGPLDLSALESALEEVERRHEVLRTVYAEDDDGPCQVIRPAGERVLSEVDLADVPDPVARARAVATAEAERPFDLAAELPLRAALLRLGEDDHVLLLVVHHIAYDAWSEGLLLREISALYAASAAGLPSPLPEPAVQYADYALWQAAPAFEAAVAPQLDHWRHRLAGAPEALDLPADRPRPAVQGYEGGVVDAVLGPEEAGPLRAFARARGLTPFKVLLAAFGALLHRYSGQTDLVVGSPIAGRNRTEVEELIGFFVNTLALRLDLGGDPGFGELAGRAGRVALEAAAHQDLPFERLVEELRPERRLSHSPLFQVVVALVASPPPPELPGVTAEPWRVAPRAARFDLALGFFDHGGHGDGAIDLRLEYSSDLFDPATAGRLVAHFRNLLRAGLAAPERRVSELALLSPAERRELLVEWNATGRDFGARGLVHEQVAEQARLDPGALAVSGGGRSLTYGELVSRAYRLARYLRSRGVGPETRVAVLLESSPERLVAVLGVLAAGGAYVSLDPSHPRERLAFLVADCGAPVVITRAELAGRLAGVGAEVLRLDAGWGSGAEDGDGEGPPPAAGLGPDNLAYVVYTSGSTGEPKGVEIPHAGLSNLVAWHRELYGVTAADRATVVANPAFDASVWEVWPYLTAGASLHVPEEAVRLSPEALARWWAAEGITLSFLPTPLAEAVLEEGLPDGLTLRALLVGGDRLHRGNVPGAPFRLMNHYGPSESSVVATVEPVDDFHTVAAEGLPAIGRPIANTRAHVLDAAGEPVPAGVPGELYVAGAGLARGYLGRPELTAAAFVPDPFAERPGERLYRTGDRVRWTRDGRLDFLGRADQQVKLRGLRIELGEVEAALARHPRVREAAVLLREGRLTAYVSAADGRPLDASPDESELRIFAAERLPEYMVPSVVVELPSLPLSSNGKVDRRALAALPPPAAAAGVEERPRTPLESALAEIWAELLGLPRVGLDDNFFALGGHSLLATRVLSRVRRAFGVELPPRTLFEASTVAELARAVAAARGDSPEAEPEEEAAVGPPLSYSQQRLWFLDRFAPGSHAYNVPLPLRLEGALDPAALAAALGEVVRRHAVLRTTYAAAGESPVQVIHPVDPAGPFRLPLVDLSALPDRLGRGESDRLLAEDAVRSFDLRRGPVLRVSLVRLREGEHRLLFNVHHIAFDGWSKDVLRRELAALYDAAVAGAPSPLPELPWQYADFAVWQRRWLAGGEPARQLAFWREALAGAPDFLELPADHPRPPAQSFRGGTRQVHLPARPTAALLALARERGTTLFMLVLAAFQAYLHRLTGQDDLLVGTPVAGRGLGEVHGLIGFFVNTLVLRGDLAGDPDFGELLARTRERCLAAYSHQDLPFEVLVEELRPARDLSRPPLVQVMLAVDNAPGQPPQARGLRFVPIEAEIHAAKLDLTLMAAEADPVLVLTFEYASDLFEGATAGRMIGHLRSLLTAAAEAPARRISELPLLSAAERAEALKGAGLPAASFPWEGSVHERFAAWARRSPEAVAVTCEGTSWTYGELAARAGRLARRLRTLGVGPESRVGLFCERSPEMLAAVLAVLAAGGAYVSLDPNYPADRVAFVLEDAGIRVLLTQAALAGRLPETGAEVVLLDGEEDGGPASLELEPVDPSNAAYVIYTSGSTGRPKGVVVEHRQVSRLLTATDAWYDFGPEDVWTLFHSYAFDFSVWEIWGALAFGGRLVVVPYWVSREPEAFLDLLAREQVTVLNQTPSAFRQLALAESAGPVRELALRQVVFGGEALEMASLAPWFARHGDERPRLVNMYGITETTVHVTYRPVSARDLKAASVIGEPIPDLQVYVLEPGLEPGLAPAPLLVAGEIHVGGAGLARGYLNRPELTAERFVPDPFSGVPGARLYRSGDLARRLPGGDLAYLGRIDQQVKIRGFRIELGEIEAALSSHPAVGEAVVLALADPAAGGSRLVAYVAGAEVPGAAELRSFLKDRLPEHMVPAVFVALPSLPLTPNGKADRKALVRLEAVAEAGGAVTAPRTPLERALASVFSGLLGVAEVGAESDFFQLGGHSLLAVRLAAEIRRELGADVPVRAVFEQPTVAGLARFIEAARAGGGTAGPAFVAAVRSHDRHPLSYSQRRLWFLDQFTPGSHAYNIPFPLRVEGGLDPGALAAALTEIVRRHEVLRTIYLAGERDPSQIVQPAAPLPLPLVDLAALPAEVRAAESLRLAAEDAARPFDLANGPVFRAALARLAPAEHLLLLGVHHIAFDGWSVAILLRELAALYGAFAAGRPSPLPEPAWQYADFAAWQRSWLAGDALAEQIGFWRRTLAGAPDFLELPTDRPRPAVQSLRGRTLSRSLGPQTAAALRGLAREGGQTLFMLLLAGFQSLLRRATGQADVVVGSPIAGRNRAEVEDLIGFFVNTLALRSDLADDPPFGRLLARVRETSLAAYAHQDLPFEVLVEELRPGRDLSRSPLVQVLLVLQNAGGGVPQPPGLRLTPLETEVLTAKFDLTVGAVETEEDGGLVLSFEYATDLFEAATVERMAGHLASLLAAATADPSRRISELPLLSEAERAEALAQAGDPALSFPWEGCVHERFAEWARRSPEAVAVTYEGISWTYGELAARAGRLARRLRTLGVGPESRVGLFCERSPEMLAAVLAVLAAGGAYVPLDPNYPADRVAFVLEDAGIRALLTQTALADRLPETGAEVVLLDDDEDAEGDGGSLELTPVDPADAAYVIYTSGSTGRPKGVVVEHRQVSRLLTATDAWYGFGPEDVWTLFHSYAFDFSVWEIWGALAFGGRLVVVPYWVSREPEAFLDLLARERVTVLNQTPSAFRQLALAESAGPVRELALRQVVFGGEALEMASLAPWFARHGDERPRLVNMYGITETTVHVTYRPVSARDLKAASVIGEPVPDLQVYVLEPGLEPAPLLVAGEIHVGGAGLARGYLNRPELTAERFVPDPFSGVPGARLYRSGDLARRLPGGDLAYLGRIDQQVKIRGFRIELGEIEAALSSHPAVGEAVVLALADPAAGGSRLVAYVAGSAVPEPAELRSFLKDRLPEHMVPSGFVSLESLPLTPNGKADRKALARLEPLSERTGATAPRTPMEETVAAIFAALLGLPAVGADDGFFDLGGHSLLAVRAVSEIRRALGVDIPVRALFEHPTVAGLARLLEGQVEGQAGAEEAAGIPRAPRDGGPIPLSYAQSRLWFLDRLAPGTAAYNIPLPLRVEGRLDPAVLAAVLSEVVRRHEALRTTFAAGPTGEPRQEIAPAAAVPLPLADLSGLPPAARREEAARAVDDDANRPFDLVRGPVFRSSLLRLGAREHLWLFNVHHVAFDGWSEEVLRREVASLYEAFAAGRPAPLPDLPLQYADFAVWQRRELAGGALAAQRGAWLDRLRGAPTVLELPADHPRPPVQSFRGGVRKAVLPVPVEALRALAGDAGATPFMLLLAAFAALLRRHTGRDDLLVGSPVANRDRAEVQGIVGFFVNTLVLRLDTAGDPAFAALLRQTRETALFAFENQDLPFDLLVDELRPERDLSRSPLVQVMLLVEREDGGEPPHPPGLRLTPAAADLRVAKFDLTLTVSESGERLRASAEYPVELFEPATVDRLLAHLGALLAGAVADPGARLSELPLLADAERHQMLVEWSDAAAAPAWRAPVHEVFAAMARREPDATALVHGRERVSRGELAALAGRLARRLRSLGVGPEVPVAVAAERSVGMVAALLGVLGAGGAYVPLDPSYPLERLAWMLEDCGAPVLVTQGALLPSLPPFAGAVVLLDDEAEGPEAPFPAAAVDLDGLAYVIYTSGSTGRPKGVQVAHRGLANLAAAQIPLFDLGPGRRALQFASFSFDASVSEIFTALLSGAELHVADREELLGPAFGRLVRERGITTATLTPSALAAFEAAVPGDGLATISTLVVAGEACPPDLAARWSRGRRFVDAYGPTEATVCASAEVGLHGGAPTLGRPIANTRLAVLDGAVLPVPLGSEGEIAIAGVGLARGYLGRPDLTAERFVPDPAGAEPGARIYRTGDLGRFLPDGRLEFRGRVDQQVKVRGVRIEPGEVEAALLALPGVREAAVVAREDAPGGRRLVAYVVPSAGEAPPAGELRRALAARLPEPLIPSAFVTLAALPLTANGKLDRAALPRPGEEAGDAFVSPRGPLEELVAGIWCEVLGRERVGADEPFFELGGHSLLATQVISRLDRALGIELPVRALFEAQTVAGLAARIEAERAAGRGGEARRAPALVPAPRDGRPAPLSFAQGRLWLLDCLEPGSPLYNVPEVLALDGPLDRAALAAALGEVVRRHEVLRTRFAGSEAGPVQAPEPAAPFALPLVDLAGVADPGEREAAAGRLAAAEALRPFDLSRPPLLRAALLRLGEAEHRLLLTLHHIASDGWSQGILVRELAALYPAFAAGRPSPLPEPRLQYADFAVWQRSWLSGEVLAAELSWWRERLAGAPDLLDLPADRPRPAVRSGRGGQRGFVLPAPLARRLAALARREGTTLFMLLLAGFEALLSRYTGREDLLVGSPIANRNRAETEGLIGFFVNTLVLRADLGGEPTFRELLRRCREATLAAYEHQDVPFEKLVEELRPERSLSHTPLIQVLFALQNAPAGALELEGLTVRPLALGGRTAKFDLTLALEEREEGLAGAVEYAADLFDPATVDRLARHLAVLLDAAAERPEEPAAALPLLTPAELRQTVEEWGGGPSPYPRDACVHELVEEWAARTPGAVALVWDGGSLTYGELDARAGRLARVLRARGVGPEVRVAVALERSAELVVALLAVLKAGGAYVPLDPGAPRERLAALIADSGAPLLLAGPGLAGRLPAAGAEVVALEAGWEEALAASPSEGPDEGPRPDPRSLAYVMFTSGTTGRPKGVATPHRAIVRLVRGNRFAKLDPSEVLLLLAPVSFDASTFEIWGALANGARLAIHPAERPGLEELGEALGRHGVSTLWLTAGLFHSMVERNAAGLRPVRQLLAGGDVLSPRHVRAVLAAHPGLTVINGYGPTENTTFTACHAVASPAEVGEAAPSIPIGRPIANTRVAVVDGGFRPLPAGVPGELLAGGDGLARGYLGRPDLTAERFVPDPVSGEPGARLYRTGDLVRWLPDGRLDFLGRIDQQVKIRGFRIEPAEIEAALAGHPALAEAVVVALPGASGLAADRRLAAYVVPRPGGAAPAAADLRAYLRERLPEPMVPAAWVVLGSLPLTANGKVDRRALPAPEDLRAEDAAPFAAPVTPEEELLAALFSELLGGAVGVHDGFFDLGGHSLLAAQLASRVREAFGVELPLRQVFETPTVAELAAFVSAARRERTGLAAPPVERAPRTGPLPLSFAQRRLWFLDRLAPGSPVYNVPFPLRLRGGLDPGALARALSEVARRHEALRTTFAESDGEPRQEISPPAPLPLPLVDLAGLPGGRGEEEGRCLVAAEARRPFDLEAGPLLRAALLRLEAEEHWLLLTVHHIVADGWSMEILLRELAALYGAFAAGAPSPLPELPVQYADFAVWQRRWLAGEVLEAQLGYWRHRLAGAPAALELPTDRPRPAVESHRGALLSGALPAGTAAAVRALCRREGATLFMTALAALDALLLRYSRQEDLAVGSTTANRNRAETEGLIGFFVNTLVLRADLAGDPPFGALLRQVRETALAAYGHQDLPFETLVEELRPGRDLSRSPFFQVLLNVHGGSRPAILGAALAAEPLPVDAGTAKFDLGIALVDDGEGLGIALEYATDLFEPATAARILGHFGRLLSAAAAAPGLRLWDLPLLDAAEAAQLVSGFNDAAAPEGEAAGLHELFAAQAARTPERTALVAPDSRRLTYRELDGLSDRLARRLRGLGVGPEVLAGVMMDRTAELVVALLAVLKAGGAYVPIDPAYPRPRVTFLLESSRAAVLLTRRALLADFAGSLPPAAVPLFLDAGWELEPAPGPAAGPRSLPADLAYVIYTSGSTGTPKGVALTHGSAATFARWARGVFPPEDLACVLAGTSVCFDLSVFEIFVTLAWGGTVALAENALGLPSHPAASEVTLVNTVPSAMAELVRAGGVPPSVRTVNLAGEALQGALVEAIHERTAAVRVYNLYGPSEDTTYSTFTLVPPGTAVPGIGRPVAGTRAYVLDPALRPAPLGVPGELHLAGEGLARGYLGRPDLTAERFLPDPFGPPGSRLYRTGDLARFRPDATLDFLGRIDHQVKVRGFRIELGEIEAALARVDGVREGAVLALSEPGGEGSRLVAFVAPAGAAPAAGELRAALRERLPEYMVPSAFVVLPALPRTPNGKLDRRALELAAQEGGAASPAALPADDAPRTPVEEVIAGLWSDLFGRPVGVHDHFFELGGHSLLAVRAVSRLRAALGVELPLDRLFASPTVAGLAAEVERRLAESHGVPLPPVTPAPRTPDGELPLSFAQQRLWLLDRVEPGNPVFNLPSPLRLVGPLDAAALAAALAEVVRRHEALRTVFAERAGRPVQVVLPAAPVPLPLADLSGLPAERREAEARRLADEEARLPFDLARGPVFRAALLRLGPADHALLATAHHIASDGWSVDVLARELAALHAAFAAGRPSPLAEPALQYADFAVWQRRHLDGEALAALVGRFRERFGTDLPVLRLPTDRPRPAVQTTPGAYRSVVLPPAVSDAARRLSRRSGATLFMTLLAAFQALLARYTGQERIVVGSPVAGRDRAELEGLIGFFVNTVVLPGDLGGDPTFRELLDRTRGMALAAYATQDLPFDRLVEALQPERDRSRTPLFQVMFALRSDPGGAADAEEADGGLAVEGFPATTATSQFDLTLYTAETPEGIWAGVEYNTDLFEAATIERLLAHYGALLAAATAAPETRLSALPPAASELPRAAAEEAPAPAAAPDADSRRDRLASRMSKLSQAQREALEKRLRGGGAA